jgi:hypothetical protein
VEDRQHRFNVLRSILLIINNPNLVSGVDKQVTVDLIAVLTQTLGCLQQSFSRLDDFTSQNKAVYYLVALCLRTISDSIVHRLSSFSSVWGDHWCFEGTLDWLSCLLVDDEIRIQKLGLGILADLILIPESYQFVLQKTPNFLDMAFSFALDPDRSYFLRKESFHVVNNFLVRFCRDHGLDPVGRPDCVLKQYDSNILGNNEVQTTSTPAIYQILAIFENCLFFERLRDVLEGKNFVLGYPAALSELLNNLAHIAPGYVCQKVLETELWRPITSIFVRPDALDRILFSQNEPEDRFPPYSVFKNQQYHVVHDGLLRKAQIDIIDMLLVSCGCNAQLAAVLGKDVSVMDAILDHIINHLDLFQRDEIKRLDVLLLERSLRLLDELYSTWITSENAELSLETKITDSFLRKLVECFCRSSTGTLWSGMMNILAKLIGSACEFRSFRGRLDVLLAEHARLVFLRAMEGYSKIIMHGKHQECHVYATLTVLVFLVSMHQLTLGEEEKCKYDINFVLVSNYSWTEDVSTKCTSVLFMAGR